MKKRLMAFLAMMLLFPTLPLSADKMTVTFMVSYRNAPLSGAEVYVNEVFRGMTNGNGQFSFNVAVMRPTRYEGKTLNIRIKTAWLSYETSVEILEGDTKTIITIYVPWKKK